MTKWLNGASFLFFPFFLDVKFVNIPPMERNAKEKNGAIPHLYNHKASVSALTYGAEGLTVFFSSIDLNGLTTYLFFIFFIFLFFKNYES